MIEPTKVPQDDKEEEEKISLQKIELPTKKIKQSKEKERKVTQNTLQLSPPNKLNSKSPNKSNESSSDSSDNDSSSQSQNEEIDLLDDKHQPSPVIEWVFDYKSNEEKTSYTIVIGQKTYEIDLQDDSINSLLGNNIKFLTILNNLEPLRTLFLGKQQKQYPDISKITKHWQYTSIQSYFDHIESLINYRKKQPTATMPPEEEANRCCICLEELFPGILDYKIDEIISQLEEENEEHDVVQLSLCDGHGFHAGCFKQFINGQDWVKCPVCMKIYGVMIGEYQPEGTMSVHIDKHLDCEGHPGEGTIIINYDMKGGETSKCRYPPTKRIAYMPNTEDAKQVIKLFRTCFDRKLMFIIGSSVTTGRNNVIVWNGIHHKTKTYGGSSHYGWPDPTYFNRVRFEFAAKGIY